MAKSKDETTKRFISKKCPNCFIYLPINATECDSCKTKVGEVDKFGMAKKPTNWAGYITAAVMWIVFMVYCWFAFIKE